MVRKVDLLGEALEQRRHAGTFRTLTHSSSGVDFISNDYLGLAQEPVELKSVNRGSGASRLLSGNRQPHLALENELAHWYVAERALLFHSGFEANHGLFSMLGALGYRVLYDEEMHASVRVGLLGARVAGWSFKHNDLNDLAAKLERNTEPAVVVTESVFSMSGDLGDLKGIAELKHRYDFTFVVDEAHGTGTVGGFTGLTGSLHLLDAVDLRLHTFGKALGATGACWVGESRWMDGLVNFCKPFIYSTAPSPVMVELVESVHRQFEDLYHERQTRLNELIAAWGVLSVNREGYSRNPSPIQYKLIGDAKQTMKEAEKLRLAGFDVAAIRTPTVKPGDERLRISLHSFNTLSQLDELLRIVI